MRARRGPVEDREYVAARQLAPAHQARARLAHGVLRQLRAGLMEQAHCRKAAMVATAAGERGPAVRSWQVEERSCPHTQTAVKSDIIPPQARAAAADVSYI